AHTAGDFAEYRAAWCTPLAQAFAGCEVHELPPNGQGIAALQALGMLQARLAELPASPDDAASLHWQIEATKLALADLYPHVADPAAMRVEASALLDAAYLRERAGSIDPLRARHPASGLGGGGTVYLCTADRDGRMVSLIQSNYEGFGSGIASCPAPAWRCKTAAGASACSRATPTKSARASSRSTPSFPASPRAAARR
uniref:gamma-glutamyltransferase n=1 Tax=Ramlibacter sp. TaxID=1917967 RepID=UPI0025D801DA